VGCSGGGFDAGRLSRRSATRARASVYQEDIGWNLEHALLDYLTPSERAAIGPVSLEIPLRGGLAGHRALRRNGLAVVEMPAESLRFFSDLCTATAWLAARGYSLSTLTDYLNLLKYGDPSAFGRRQMPLPLVALQIPEDQLDEPGVESRRSACFSTGVVFILAHELGHLALRHQGYGGIGRAEAQANEAAADAFAVELMSRSGDLPLGALYYFTAMSYLEPHRGDFDSDAAWQAHVSERTHPVSPERIQSLAESLLRRRQRFAAGAAATAQLADELRPVAAALIDTDLQQLRRLQGESVRPSMLAPRRSDTWIVEPPDDPLPARPFSGYFKGWLGPSAEDGVEAAVILYRDGNRVRGRYSYAGIGGSLGGRIDGSRLGYRFSEPGASGTGELRAIGNDVLEGRFRTAGGAVGALRLSRP